jgi:hypothetical protein
MVPSTLKGLMWRKNKNALGFVQAFGVGKSRLFEWELEHSKIKILL